jgi:hypothetical protein
MVHNVQNYSGFTFYPLSSILRQAKFQKLHLFPSSGWGISHVSQEVNSIQGSRESRCYPHPSSEDNPVYKTMCFLDSGILEDG